MSKKRPRVMLADDHCLILEAFRMLLSRRVDVIGAVSDGRALVEKAPALRPDVILLDLAMPMLNGLEAGQQVRKVMPDVKLIYLTMNEDPHIAAMALGDGAAGYLLKTSPVEELFQAIDAALHGDQYVTPRIAESMKDVFVGRGLSTGRRDHLTPRQREVVQLLAEGRPMKEVAFLLGVTTRTVAFHKYQVMEERGLKSTASLVQFAIKNRILVQ